MAIRTLRFEVYRISGDYKAARKRWHEASDNVQMAINAAWQAWLVYHIQHSTPASLRLWLAELKAWHDADKETRGDKPKWQIKPVSPECGKAIYAAAKDAVPTLHARPLALLLNEVGRLIRSRKSAQGSLPGWMSILLCRESIPSSTRAQPIPFDRQNSSLLVPLEKGGRFRLSLRADKYEGKTKSGKSKSESTVDEIELLTNRRGIRGHEAVLWRIIDGKDKLKGSSLAFDRRSNKWFALLAVESEIAERESGEGQAVLLPGRQSPFVLVIKGRHVHLGGTGEHVSAVRQRIVGGRRSRQSNYRYGQRSGKGHGRNRALAWIKQSERDWSNFCTTYNHDVTKKALTICAQEGIAKLVYLQPAGEKSETRLLSTIGKHGHRESSGWTWFQVATMLKYKAEGTGIQIEVRKCDTKPRLKAA